MKKTILFLLLLFSRLVYSQFVPEWVSINSQGSFDSFRPSLTVLDNSGNMYTANTTFGANYDVITTKYNSTGNVVWTRIYNSSAIESQDRAYKLMLDVSGSLFVLGNSNTDDYMFNKVFILKYSANGDLLASIDYRRGENPVTVLANSELDSLGNLYVCGATDNMNTFIDSSLIVKFSSALNVLWEKTKRDTTARNNFVQSVIRTTGGNTF